jgi:uncharacterized protein
MPSWHGRKKFTANSVITVEIVYALPQHSIVKTLQLPANSRLADALTSVMGDADFAGVDLANLSVGIFGKLARRDQPLQEGDRIELYRPLLEEPKLARRKRASKPARS